MTQPGETDAMTINDHVIAINDHLEEGYVQEVYISDVPANEELIARYNAAKQYILEDDTKNKYYTTEKVDIISTSQKDKIRHSQKKLTSILRRVIK